MMILHAWINHLIKKMINRMLRLLPPFFLYRCILQLFPNVIIWFPGACILPSSHPFCLSNLSSNVLSRFSPVVAPIKVTIFPLMQKEELNTIARQLSHSITRAGLTSITDTTGTTIGKRYARTDEIGVPFAITVDFDTVADKTVTLRDRDTTGQVRIPIAEVAGVLRGLVDGELEWSDVQGKYPAQSARED